jgi:type IV secretory pathway VirB10-like protein
VTDQQGVAGLTGTVDSHFWRLVGAVLITSALRGGAQAVTQGMAGTGVVGTIGSSIAQ